MPLYVIYQDHLYLSGYSYFRLKLDDILLSTAIPTYASQEENNAMPEFRWAIANRDAEKAFAILGLHQTLPRLLTTVQGRCDKDAHLMLLGMLLYYRRVQDLERLYGIGMATDSEACTISQDESFGETTSLRYYGIHIRRAESTDWQSRGIKIDSILGNGSFGIVFMCSSQLVKFSMMSAEYCRELLMHLVLTVTNEGLPREVVPVTHVTANMIPHHILGLRQLTPITRERMARCLIDSTLRQLFVGEAALRDRFLMHLDLSTTNLMWDSQLEIIRVIDCAGTIGDDTFLDLGPIIDRACTRSTRPPEYTCPDNLWQRNESSEILSIYYAIMSHVFDPGVINLLPEIKEEACLKERGEGRIHEAIRSKISERSSLESLISLPDDIGIIGSLSRFSHIRRCLTRYVNLWPRGTNTIRGEKRQKFIDMLLLTMECLGERRIDFGGLTTRKIVPSPYLSARCVNLYDALATVTDEADLEYYMNSIDSYQVLVNAILYISLAPCKIDLLDIEHYPSHPVHVILQVLFKRPEIMSIFLSPITAFILILLESPKATRINDTQPRRIIRCLYNLRRDRRHLSEIPRIGKFVKDYLSKLLREPLIVDHPTMWWKGLLRIGGPNPSTSVGGGSGANPPTCTSLLEVSADAPALTPRITEHIDNLVRLWFT